MSIVCNVAMPSTHHHDLHPQIYAALYEWKTGSKLAAKFEGNVFATIYKALCQDLKGIKAPNVKAYHAIMSELYSRVM
jgi:Domain of unknown function (DUF6532)